MSSTEIENRNQNPVNRQRARSRQADAVSGTPQRPTISIVIPVHNGGAAFRHCLETVSVLEPPPLEILVVVDGHPDASADIAARFHAKVIHLAQRRGPARARNEGAFRAQGDIVLFIDADVAVPPDLLQRVGQAFCAAPDTAAIIGSYDSEPAARNVVSQYKNLMHHHVHQCSEREAATFWGACGAIRRDVFLALGGFDERYRRPCVEDIDLGYRLRAAQYPVRLWKSLQVKHLKRWTFLSLLKSDIFDRALPWTELIMRYRLFRNDLNLRHSDRLSVLTIYTLLVAAPLSGWSPFGLAISGSLSLLLLVLNSHTYRFFIVRRGIPFAAAAVALHWLSLVYSGMAFVIGIVRYGLVPRFRGTFWGRGHCSEPFPSDHRPESAISRPSAGGGA